MRRHWHKIWRVLPYARPYWRLGGGSIAATIAGALIALAEPWPLAFLVDSVLGGQDGKSGKPVPSIVENLFGTDPVHLIVFAVVLGLVVALLTNLIAVFNEFVNTKLSQRMILDFRSDLFDNALRQSQSYTDAHHLGEFVARINYEAASVGDITVALPPLVQGVLTLAGMAFIAYRIDPELALVALTVVPFIYYSTGYYGKKIEPRLRETRRLEGRSIGLVLESIPMLRVVATFCREQYELLRFRDLSRSAVDARVSVTIRQTLFSLFVNVTTATGTALVLGLGGYHVLKGKITVGQLLVVLAYVHSVYQPLEQISHTLAHLQEQFIFFELSLHLLDSEPEIKDPPNAIALPPVAGQVTFEDVTFTYPGRDHTLRGIDFDIPAGSIIGLVGRTGAGKTTLVSFISRFLDPAEGRVLVDGHDVRTLELESLRSQVSMVLQEPMLFAGTVKENIAYGRASASDEEIVEAAQAANAHEFIERLPQGYDTQIAGDNGTHLSGGERQRICVARAFLKDAPILILDEPTSSIDSRTEAVILDALDRLIEGRTTFMIAHRLSTIRHCDRLLVLDDGNLIEQGTHDELMALEGAYFQMHETQHRQRARRGTAALVFGGDGAEQPVIDLQVEVEAEVARAERQVRGGVTRPHELMSIFGRRGQSALLQDPVHHGSVLRNGNGNGNGHNGNAHNGDGNGSES